MPFAGLTEAQAEQLARVEMSFDGSMNLAPSQVTLANGDVLDHVYLAREAEFRRFRGNPELLGPRLIRIEEVETIRTSPMRLPAHLATELYQEGESGMGYFVFTVVLHDGRLLPFVSGSGVDFPLWPPGVDTADIEAVLPHVGRDHFRDRRPEPTEQCARGSWCLYS